MSKTCVRNKPSLSDFYLQKQQRPLRTRQQYLGRGIGHLEQFPPANNDSKVVYKHKYEDENLGVIGDDGGTGGAGEGKGDKDEDEEDEGDEDEDGEGEDEIVEDSDPGESSDEEMGNSY